MKTTENLHIPTIDFIEMLVNKIAVKMVNESLNLYVIHIENDDRGESLIIKVNDSFDVNTAYSIGGQTTDWSCENIFAKYIKDEVESIKMIKL